MDLGEKEAIRRLLCDLGTVVQTHVTQESSKVESRTLSEVSDITKADTIYQIDKFSEDALLAWFEQQWPEDLPVEVIAEGLEGSGPVVFPKSSRLEDTKFKVIIDPIDGTRELMYDKRSAWVIAGVAPQRFKDNRIGDVQVAMITELPTSKQRYADQISGYKGCGREGLTCERFDIVSGGKSQFRLKPSTASNVEHGVAAFVKFFPEGKELIARFETDLWRRLGVYGEHKSPVIFDDQYISTAGQMYELLVGHYRFYGDMRPYALQLMGALESLTCHPYDVGAGLLLKEAGCVYESPWGDEVDVPMDTTTPVSWVAYANRELAESIRPVLTDLMSFYFDSEDKKGS